MVNLEWKKVLLYAIGPAVIAGLFSIAPKLYDIATEPKAELTYSSIIGPELHSESGVRKIIAIAIENSGKRPLSNVTASLTVDSGRIEAHKIQEGSGLKLSSGVTDREVSLAVLKLHPGEKFSLSALVLNTAPALSPHFALRSDEVLGSQKEVTGTQKKELSSILGAFGTAASVFAMALAFMLKAARSGFGFHFKKDIIFYIPARLGLPITVNEMLSANGNMTYLRMADMLLAHGTTSDANGKQKAVTALKCMLLIKDMANTSRSIVLENLRVLEGKCFNESELQNIGESAVSVGDILTLRRQIDEIIFKTDI
jgi:hypothetical protein